MKKTHLNALLDKSQEIYDGAGISGFNIDSISPLWKKCEEMLSLLKKTSFRPHDIPSTPEGMQKIKETYGAVASRKIENAELYTFRLKEDIQSVIRTLKAYNPKERVKPRNISTSQQKIMNTSKELFTYLNNSIGQSFSLALDVQKNPLKYISKRDAEITNLNNEIAVYGNPDIIKSKQYLQSLNKPKNAGLLELIKLQNIIANYTAHLKRNPSMVVSQNDVKKLTDKIKSTEKNLYILTNKVNSTGALSNSKNLTQDNLSHLILSMEKSVTELGQGDQSGAVSRLQKKNELLGLMNKGIVAYNKSQELEIKEENELVM